jgi:hypothetical protein
MQYYEVVIEIKEEVDTKDGSLKFKRIKERYLVNATSVAHASSKSLEAYESTSLDARVITVRESNIMAVVE